MIKTFVSADLSELDGLVNIFMELKGKSLPVRTENIVIGNAVQHKATVFFDADRPKISDSKPIPEDTSGLFPETPDPKPQQSSGKSEQIGALWKQKDGKISGTFQAQRLNFTAEIKKGLKATKTKKGDDMFEGQIDGVKVRIIKNAFRMTVKHPDYVILKA